MSHRQKNALANHSVKRRTTAGTSPLSLYTLFAAFLDAFSVEHPLQPLVGSLRAQGGFVRGEGESVRFRCRFRRRFNLTVETCHYARLKLQDRSTISRLSYLIVDQVTNLIAHSTLTKIFTDARHHPTRPARLVNA